MKLAKTIEILELNTREAGNKMPIDCRVALQLGIEAIKRLQVGRNNPGTHWNDLLPGETPEQ